MLDIKEEGKPGRPSTQDLPRPMQVLKGIPGLKIVTIIRETGLAASTVSQALNGKPVKRETAQAIMAVFRQHGWKGYAGRRGHPYTEPEQIFTIGYQGARNDVRDAGHPHQRSRVRRHQEES